MKLALLLVFALSATAHVVSMSTGEARLNGARLDYELRMPLYEVAHIRNPEPELFGAIRFVGSGQDARLLQHSCREDGANLVCTGLFLFEREADQFDVECRFASITVPNHVHLLRATHGQKTDQAAFDGSFPTATIHFRPPTAWETAMRDASAGFWRAVAGIAQILFLAALVLAGRSRRELALLIAMFLAGQALTVIAQLSTRISVSPRFIEAATALTIAYLAVEILVLPAAGQRWLVVGVLGILHGMYFDMLLAAGDYSRTSYLAGASLAELTLVAILWGVVRAAAAVPLARSNIIPRVFASLLLLTGISWFLIRLRN